jgi:hypothetical protein
VRAPDDHEGFELLSEDPGEVRRAFLERGWGDRLPIVAPTAERVEEVLGAGPKDPDELIGIIPPRLGQATRRLVAVNAVMAGFGFFAVSSPLTAASQRIGTSWDAFVLAPVDYTFQRPLGDF